jgi:hypothetical protein
METIRDNGVSPMVQPSASRWHSRPKQPLWPRTVRRLSAARSRRDASWRRDEGIYNAARGSYRERHWLNALALPANELTP